MAKGVGEKMVPAQKMQTMESFIAWYHRLLIRRSFSKVHIKCPSEIDLSIPTLYVCNHHNWWDFFLAFFVNEHMLGQDAAYLVEKHELGRLALHKKTNVLPYQVDSYMEMRETLDAGSEWLSQSYASLWAFSQGDHPHPDYRPLRFLPGLGSLLEKVRYVQVVPVAFYYTFEWDPRPSVYIQFGSPLVPSTFEKGNRRNWVSACEKALSLQLDELRIRVIHGNVGDFDLAISGFKRMDEWIAECKKGAKPLLERFYNKRKRGRMG